YRGPRNVAKKAEAYLKQKGIAYTSYWGPECEFYIFNSISFDQSSHSGFYFIVSEEGIWNSGQPANGRANLGYRPRYKEGYFPVPPTDKLQDLRSEMMLELIVAGADLEVQHPAAGTAAQAADDMRFATSTTIARTVRKHKDIARS